MGNNTEVIFENIEQRILKEIKNAHYAIFVSVAWFTNKKLFEALLEKAKSNCYVSIIIQLDEINSQCGIDYDQIKIGRSECFKISKDAELLHDKFCVIDFQKVITGSYNWTYKASHNSENILVLNDPSVATQYISRFEQQKTKFNASSMSTSSSVSTISNNKSSNIHDTNTIIPPQLRHCSSCGWKLGVDDIFSPYCGTQQKSGNIDTFIICNKCSHKQVPPILSRGTKYCTNCGNQIREKNELPPDKCPICKNDYNRNCNENFCTYCGLSHSIHTTCSEEILKTGYYRLILKGVRPEFKTFEQIQQCYKCHVINIWGANYCRSCGENISTHARDKYEREWVDLGLSVLWSTSQIGGFTYRWMDTERYYYDGYFSYGKRTNKDTASELLGHKWRMPTKQEVEELIEKCEWEVIKHPKYNNLQLKITGPNGNHLLWYLSNKDDFGSYYISFCTSSENEKERPFAFKFCTISSTFVNLKNISNEGIVSKRRLRIREMSKNDAMSIFPVSDKRWQGKL